MERSNLKIKDREDDEMAYLLAYLLIYRLLFRMGYTITHDKWGHLEDLPLTTVQLGTMELWPYRVTHLIMA